MTEALTLTAPVVTRTARGAVLSPCGRYRYRLWRTWDASRAPALWIMLNPSTADATRDDLTLAKCQGFARQWQAGGVVVVNLFAWRATSPAELAAQHAAGVDVVGPDNDAHVREAISAAVGGAIVCAWGDHPLARIHWRRVGALLPTDAEVVCLGRTKAGAPKHPSRIPYSTPTARFFDPMAVPRA
jgi:hypothetical protein